MVRHQFFPLGSQQRRAHRWPPTAHSRNLCLPRIGEVKEEQAQAEAIARAEAAQPAEKAQPSGARLEGVESALAEATVSAAAANSSEREGAPKKMAPAAQLLSSRHAPGAKNVLDMLGTDEVDAARVGAPGITAVMPAVGEEPVAPDDIPTKDDPCRKRSMPTP